MFPTLEVSWAVAVDHIIPERFVRILSAQSREGPCDPHVRRNLIALCASCHA